VRYAYYVLHVDAGDDTSYVPGGVGEGEVGAEDGRDTQVQV